MNHSTDASTSFFGTHSVQSKKPKKFAHKRFVQNSRCTRILLLLWYNTILLWKTCLGTKASFPLLKHLFSLLHTCRKNSHLWWNSSDRIQYLKLWIFTSRVAKKHESNEITVLRLRGNHTPLKKIGIVAYSWAVFHCIIFQSIKSLHLLFVNIVF